MSGASRAAETDGIQENSYLKRYYRTLPEEKRLMLEKSLMNANNEQAQVSGPGRGHVGGPRQVPGPEKLRTGADAEDAEDNKGKKSQKSSTCVIL